MIELRYIVDGCSIHADSVRLVLDRCRSRRFDTFGGWTVRQAEKWAFNAEHRIHLPELILFCVIFAKNHIKRTHFFQKIYTSEINFVLFFVLSVYKFHCLNLSFRTLSVRSAAGSAVDAWCQHLGGVLVLLDRCDLMSDEVHRNGGTTDPVGISFGWRLN